MARKSKIIRKTTETDIVLEMELGGKKTSKIDTSIPFIDHMLNLTAKHGCFFLSVKSKGDREIDDHHLAEDLGICFGKALSEALGDKKGIRRYGSASVPMDESLCSVAIDISGRPFLVFNAKLGNKRKIGEFDVSLVKEFFKAIVDNSRIALHINLIYGDNLHHMVEAIFKAFAVALKDATSIDTINNSIPSTKGSID
ncbi:MAG: imidazoleglycerol-phosphate dehydratase HisB [Deltaproteobacteria bacterium]